MTFPPAPTAPTAPATIGTQPQTAYEINNLVGLHLKAFLASRATINQDAKFFGVTDLKAAPYYFTDQQEAVIKSAIADLDTALDAINTSFIDQIVGMF